MKTSLQKGLTLIELLTTMSVFVIAITAVVNLFGYAFQAQSKTLHTQEVLANVSYASGYISRALRMAQKDLDGKCIQKGYNFENPGGELTKIRFLNSDGVCQEFFKEENTVKIAKSTDGSSANLQTGLPLLPTSTIIVNDLRFFLEGESQEDNLQPKVTFLMKISSSAYPDDFFYFQTSISQRNLDVKY